MRSSYQSQRRIFLQRLGMLGILGMQAVSCPKSLLAQMRTSPKQPRPLWVDQHPWKTIAAAQQILFPSGDNIPGADDINAIIYLHDAIENPIADGDDKAFIFRGTGWLNELAVERMKKEFTELSLDQQETLLQIASESRAGKNWISLLLTYILEALLADPIYGGNPDGVGWQWLEHQPGFPTPTSDSTWYKLLQKRYQS